MKNLIRGMSTPLIITLAVVVIAVLYIGGTYNGLIRASQSVDAQWAQVESQYQRRMDLIPNLVEAVKGTMKQEQTVFTAIADARTHYANPACTGHPRFH
jgi:LemA protein